MEIGKVLVVVFLVLYLPSQWKTKDLDGVEENARLHRLAWVLMQANGVLVLAYALGV